MLDDITPCIPQRFLHSTVDSAIHNVPKNGGDGSIVR